MSIKWNTHVKLICKPEQSGKTFLMIQNIVKDLSPEEKNLLIIQDFINNINNEDDSKKKIINIIFCDNNLLLTQQTSNRVDSGLNCFRKDTVSNEMYLEFSSHSRTEYSKRAEVFEAILTKEIHNIICCTNKQRIRDVKQIIISMNKMIEKDVIKKKYKFKIWLDEADKFIRYIDIYNNLIERYENVFLYCLTATPDTLFKQYNEINVYPLEYTVTEDYHGWDDNHIIIEEDHKYDNFIKNVLKKNKEKIVKKSKWFIPGLSIKKSHTSIKDICIKNNMVVCIVNGDGIKIYYPNNNCKEYKKDIEFGIKIKQIYKENKLHEYPFVITGYICISRGITINSSDFLMDYAILSQSSSRSETSQIAGRLKGNMKKFKNYKQPTIFTTEKFDNIAREFEKKSRNLAKLAFFREREGRTTIIEKTDFHTCGEKYEYIRHYKLCKSFTEAIKVLQSVQDELNFPGEKEIKINKNIDSNALHPTEGGYTVTSKLLKEGKTINDFTDEDRLTLEEANKISNSRCISKTGKGSRYLILPVYENINSLPKDVKFQVRYLKVDK